MDLITGLIAMAVANSLIFSLLAVTCHRQLDLIDGLVLTWPWLLAGSAIMLKVRATAGQVPSENHNPSQD